MLLDVQHVSKTYDGTDILKDVSFHIEEKEKAALIGINGAGKTTLLKSIMNIEEPDSGAIILSNSCTVGYLPQMQEFTEKGTVYESMLNVNQRILELEKSIPELSEEMKVLKGDDLEKAMDKYSRQTEEFEQLNGYAYRSEVTGILKGLGFTEADFHKEASLLSGGEKTRLTLGHILLSSPDFLILDEPTNHLDMSSVAWLENYLLSYKGAVLIVSHDRYFINKIVSKVIEIENGISTVYKGNYDAYSEKKAALRKAAQAAYLKNQKAIEHEKAVIAKLKQFNREKSIKRAESREKKLSKIDPVSRPEDVNDTIKFSISPEKESGNDVLMCEGISKAFGKDLLFSNQNIFITKGERVALIGDNGSGKSTIMKICKGLMEPDAGTVRLGANVFTGYYDQEYKQLHPDKTVFQEISDEWPDLNNTKIRNVLAAFLITGDDVFKKIGDLSGGEQARVAFAKLMLSKANFLMLDEPTNHLDITSKEVLESALCNYTGTVFYVSHDRYFINKTATRILELKEGRLNEYKGNYDYYLEKKDEPSGSSADSTVSGHVDTLKHSDGTPAGSTNSRADTTVSSDVKFSDSKSTGAADNLAGTANQSSGSKKSWQEMKRMEAAKRKRENDLKKTEERIEKLESRDSEIDSLLSDPAIFSNHLKCEELSEEKASISKELNDLMERWEELSID